jgi:hypothetical protein
MAALNHPLLSEAVPLIPREIFPSMYKRNLRKEKGIENISNPARMQPHNCLGLGNEGTTAIRYTSSERTFIRSDSHIGAAWPGRGLCQGSRPLRGAKHAALTQTLPPGPFLRHVGNVQVWSPRDLKARDQDRGLRDHGRRRYQESFPVPVCELDRKNAALRSAVPPAGWVQAQGQHCA